MTILKLTDNIDLNNLGDWFVDDTVIHQIGMNFGMLNYYYATDRMIMSQEANRWAIFNMEGLPFHQLCYNSSVTSGKIHRYLNENGNESAFVLDEFHHMSPLHMLTILCSH